MKPVVPRGTRHIKTLTKIINYLDEKGPRNTRQILEHINTTTRYGSTPSEVGNLLAKYHYFVKIDSDTVHSALSGSYNVCVWGLNG
tara:strand:- start:971 stop:1228 length:258 start_codon:yes stop_codon:yes gene_type:complete